MKNKPSILISGHEPIARLLLSTAPHLANLQSRYTNWKYSTNKLYVTEQTVEYRTDCTLQYKLNSTVQTVHYSANCTLQYRLFRTVTIVQFSIQYTLYSTPQVAQYSTDSIEPYKLYSTIHTVQYIKRCTYTVPTFMYTENFSFLLLSFSHIVFATLQLKNIANDFPNLTTGLHTKKGQDTSGRLYGILKSFSFFMVR